MQRDRTPPPAVLLQRMNKDWEACVALRPLPPPVDRSSAAASRPVTAEVLWSLYEARLLDYCYFGWLYRTCQRWHPPFEPQVLARSRELTELERLAPRSRR